MDKICGHCINYGMLYARTGDLAEEAKECRHTEGQYYDRDGARWLEATRDATDCGALPSLVTIR